MNLPQHTHQSTCMTQKTPTNNPRTEVPPIGPDRVTDVAINDDSAEEDPTKDSRKANLQVDRASQQHPMADKVHQFYNPLNLKAEAQQKSFIK